MPTIAPFWLDTALENMNHHGFCVIDNAIDPAQCAHLRADLRTSPLRAAAVGRGNERQLDNRIRRDATHWLDGNSDSQVRFLSTMESVRVALNQHFFLGLDHYEAHYASYPVGGFYQRHYDNFRGSSPRRVTTVLYLNENWEDNEGGELVMYRDDRDSDGHALLPISGRLVIFMSEQFPHEVKPAHRERLSIAGWFRVRSE